MILLVIAGHDTTGYSIAFILAELSRNPHVQLKLHHEISLLPDNTPIDDSTVDKLTYLSHVISEGMRLWPVAASGTVREAAEDIYYNGYVIPKGSTVGMPLFAMFRSCIEVQRFI